MAKSSLAKLAKVFIDGEELPNLAATVIQHGSGLSGNQATIEEATRSTILRSNFASFRSLCENSVCVVKIDDKIVHSGRIMGLDTAVSESSEVIQRTSVLTKNLFGDPLNEVPYRAPDGLGDAPDAFEDWANQLDGTASIVFNPVVGEVAFPNMCSILNIPALCFIDPWSTKPELFERDRKKLAAAGTTGDPNLAVVDAYKFWTLHKIVEFLCDLLNGDQTNVNNPPIGDYAEIDDTGQLVRNLELNRGKYLPDLLDSIVRQYGYETYVEFDNLEEKPRIRIVRASTTNVKTLKLQLSGEDVDSDNTNVWTYALSMGHASQSANEVQILGDRITLESTFNLVPAWPDSYDADLADNFEKYIEGSHEWRTDPNARIVGRKFVLNESGEYNGVRGGNTTFDAEGLFREYYPTGVTVADRVHRRQFYPMLTLDKDREPLTTGGYLIEFNSGDFTEDKWITLNSGVHEQSEDDEGAYYNYTEFSILHNECGIYFSDPGSLPFALLNAATTYGWSQVKIRITATLKSDVRIQHVAKANTSLLLTPKRATLESPFKFSAVDDSSRFWSDVDAGTFEADVSDDRQALKSRAERLLEEWNQSRLSGRIVLPTIEQPGTYINTRIRDMNPRNVDLITTAVGLTERYPLVRAVVLDLEAQTTTLEIDSHA